MDIIYISSDDEMDEANYIQISKDVPIVDFTKLHRTLIYPQLEKKDTSTIIEMIQSVNAISKKIFGN